VKPEAINDMHHEMLSMNVAMPLSSYAVLDDQYVLFGALSLHSSIDDVVYEIEMLSANTLEALEGLAHYLN